MPRLQPCLCLFVFLAISLVASGQQPTAASQEQSSNISLFAGHYEGTATNKAKQTIPLTIDLSDAEQASGKIGMTRGVFPILGWTAQGSKIVITFDTGEETGLISAQLSDTTLTGTFNLGDDGGPIQAKKTAGMPATTAGGNSLGHEGRPVIAKKTVSTAVTAVDGKSPPTSEIMFLGVYHMHNPGLDEVNLQADDVLAPRRQEEIEELVTRLARFQPTKILIEAPYRDTYWPGLYEKYLAGEHTLGRNEIEQIAFRLAKRLELPTLYGVDFQMFMNGLTPGEIEDQKPAATPPPGETKAQPSDLSAEDQLLRNSTVTEYLFHLNSPAVIEQNHAEYMTMLLPERDDSEIYRKADLVSNWYRRNLRIFANINRVVDPGKDRVLVIIGAGHLKLLRGFAADSPYFTEVDVGSFLKP